VAVADEERLAERLGHDVGDIVEARDKEELDDAVLDQVANPMEFDVDMLGAAVHDVVLGERNAGHIVLADRRGRGLREADVSEQLAERDDLLGDRGDSDVLSLGRAERDDALLLAPPETVLPPTCVTKPEIDLRVSVQLA
jgi:hypothetical protein